MFVTTKTRRLEGGKGIARPELSPFFVPSCLVRPKSPAAPSTLTAASARPQSPAALSTSTAASVARLSYLVKETDGRAAMKRTTKRTKYGENMRKKSEQIRLNPSKSKGNAFF
jgi:hypothetical protein